MTNKYRHWQAIFWLVMAIAMWVAEHILGDPNGKLFLGGFICIGISVMWTASKPNDN
jgi:hypothetical protein